MSKNSIKDRMSTVFRGMREVARVVFTDKEVVTNFTPQKPSTPAPKQESSSSDEKGPSRKIQGNNELIVAPEYIQEMKQFFSAHTVLSSYTAPCYFNNDSCNINLHAFPRLHLQSGVHPTIKDVIVATISYEDDIIAAAEYSVTDEKVVDKFLQDIDMLTPECYRSSHDSTPRSFKDELLSRFPGMTVFDEPDFPEPDPTRRELLHDI